MIVLGCVNFDDNFSSTVRIWHLFFCLFQTRVKNANSLADNLDYLMDMSIEITSNNKMIKNYIKPITLTFKDEQMERKVIKKSEN